MSVTSAGGSPLDPPARPTMVAMDGFDAAKLEYYRGLFEHLYSLPAFSPPPSPPWWMRGGVAALAIVGGLFSTSSGELWVQQLSGQVAGYVTQRDMQDASRAIEATGADVSRFRDRWSPDQKSRFLVTAARVGRDLEEGRVTPALAREAMDELIARTDALPRYPSNGR